MWASAAGATPAILPQLTALVVAGALVAYLGFRLRLVPIVAFLVTGVAIGPNALGLVDDLEVVDAAAEVGVLLLLYTIGLEFSLARLKELRRPLLIGGGLQVVLSTGLVFAALRLAGVAPNVALFTGLLVSLSSTAIVLKVLGDRGEVASPHGRLAVAILLFQDLAVVAMVLLVPMLGRSGGSAPQIALALATAVGLVALILVLARRVVPPLLERVARTCSPELFLLTVIAICLATAYATSLAGVSVSLGAFLAGLLVSESRFNSQALVEILPLQIVFSAAFFVSVGMLLDVAFLLDNLPIVLGAVIALLVVKALTTTAALLVLRTPPAVALAAGLTLAQVGEFSFVLAQAGAAEGLTPAGLGTDGTQSLIAATVLMLAATPALAELGERVRGRLTPPSAAKPVAAEDPETLPGAGVAEHLDGHVVVAGYGRWARGVTRVLSERGVPLVVTTLSPDGATDAHAQGFPVLLGDPARTRTLVEAGLARASAVVVPDDGAERAHQLVQVVRGMRPDVTIIVRVRYAADAAVLRGAGADVVVTEEIEASAILAVRVLERYGHEVPEMVAGAHAVRSFYGSAHLPGIDDATPEPLPGGDDATPAAGLRADDDAPAAGHRADGRGTGRAWIDTQAQIDVHLDPSACRHAGEARPVFPSAPGCEDCLRTGDTWVHLRVCLTCGYVGCCDSSPNRHARRHHDGEGHSLICSGQPGETWVYCFPDDLMLSGRNPDSVEPAPVA